MASFLDDLLGSLGVQDQTTDVVAQEVTDRIKQGTGNQADQTLEGKILASGKQKRDKAIRSVTNAAHGHTKKLRDIATSEQVRFTKITSADKRNDVRVTVENYKPDDDGNDILSALESSGVVEDRCLSLKSLKPSEKILAAKAEREAAAEKSRLKVLMMREQKKAAWNNRQKGKNHRKKLKKQMEKDQKKLIEVLEENNPEIIAKMRKDYEDQRAAIRMMPNHAKRKKWARIATKFGASDAVADDAARLFEKKRETDDVLTKMNDSDDDIDEHSGSMSEASDSDDSSNTDDSSDSEVSFGNSLDEEEEFGETSTKKESRKRTSPDTTKPLAYEPESKKKKTAKLPTVEEQDLSSFIDDNGNGNDNETVAEMFVGSGADLYDEAVRDIADQADAAEGPMGDDDALIGWGNGWAGENYAEKLEEKRLAREKALSDQLKEKKKRPVYVNRKLSNKFSKYFVKDVPAGYSSEAEYKLQQSQPLGPEWNTAKSLEKKVKPKFYIENGAIIQPLGSTEVVIGKKKFQTKSGL